MSTINTSISLNSTTTFPSIATTVTNSINTQNNSFGVVKVGGAYDGPPVYLSPTPCGTQGAYIYAKAPTTNPDGVGVEIRGIEQSFFVGDPVPFATLYPGDIALIPLDPNQLSVWVSTTTGDECTLEYSFSDRGLPFGENELIISKVYGNWVFYLLDANLGKATQRINSGISSDDYPYLHRVHYVQDKGYAIVVCDNNTVNDDDGNYRIITIDTHGYNNASQEFYAYYTYTTGNNDVQVASSVVFQWSDYGDSGFNNLLIFDGGTVNNYNFYDDYELDISIYDGFNYCSSDGSVLVIGVRLGTSIHDVILVNKGRKHILYTYDDNIENYPQIIFGNQDSNTAIIMPRSSDDGQILGIKVFDTNGNLLNENAFNNGYSITSLYFDESYDYAKGKIFITIRDNSYHYFINYDPTTNLLIGGDLSWKYSRSFYPSYNVYNNGSYSQGEDSAFHEESIRINLYTSTNIGVAHGNYYYYPNTNNSFAVTYVIPGMTEPGFYELWNGLNSLEKPYIYYDSIEEGGTRNRISILYTTEPDGGALKQLTLTPTEQIVDTIVTNLSEYNDFEFLHFNDDYSMYRFSNNAGSTNEKYIIHKLGAGQTNNIVENVTFSTTGIYEYTEYVTSYGMLLVAHLDTGKFYYFNGRTNKLTQFLTSNSLADEIDNESFDPILRNKHDNSYVPGDIADVDNVLVNPSTRLLYNFRNNSLAASSTTPLPVPDNDWYIGVGHNTYVYIYWKDSTNSYIVNVYDLSFNLIRAVDTGYASLSMYEDGYYHIYNGICNNRIMFRISRYDPLNDAYYWSYKMVSSTGAVQEILLPVDSYEEYRVNDQFFWNY